MLRVSNLKIDVIKNNPRDALVKKLGIKDSDLISYKIHKKSIDSRNKSQVFYVYELDIELKNEDKYLKSKKVDIRLVDVTEYNYKYDVKSNEKIVVVGSGPAGLFCAYLLALNGLKPLVIERGYDIDKRNEVVNTFFETNVLDCKSNVCFGEGGAGTYSDGKLNTGVKDKEGRIPFILKTFYECGADEDITYEAHPHIGTDVLQGVVKNLRNKIIALGGSFRFESTLTDIVLNNDKVEKIIVNDTEEINCSKVVLAVGHSARDTISKLYNKGLLMKPKGYAVGLRVIHHQEMINESQYGKYYKYLPNASYKLTYTASNKKGVYTFCMCPGGYVVNSSSSNGYMLCNGMSNHDRNSGYSNSAVIVTINPKDFGNTVKGAIKYQEMLEQRAFLIAKGYIPIQRYKDYKENVLSTKFGNVKPKFKGGYVFANLNEILPREINNSIVEGIENFGTKIKGFNNDDTILAGVESRTSSPVRILRTETLESNFKGLYPCGEGAGFAGGITSAAIDGLKVAESIIKELSNN